MLRWMLICTCLMASAIGCAPNANGVWQPSLPWTRQQPRTAGVANPWQGQGLERLPALPSTSPSYTNPAVPLQNPDGLSFFKDLMKRADQQESLAERQRQQLEELNRVQASRQQQERQYVIDQRQKERDALAKQFKEKEQLLAERERKYRGQYDQIRGRATDLDANNRDLHSELARSQKQSKLLEEELNLLKRRLDESTQQLSMAQQTGQESGRQLQALQVAASKKRGNASIRANRSTTSAVTAMQVPGLDVRQDGDLVRISIPTDQLFQPGTAQLHQGALPYVNQIANALRTHYPQQIIGVEAHTDHGSTSLANTQWRNHHQLTSAQAMAVFEQLTNRGISAHQLFVLGHGGNHPLVSGGTLQGQSMNRRVEIVVYPETHGR